MIASDSSCLSPDAANVPVTVRDCGSWAFDTANQFPLSDVENVIKTLKTLTAMEGLPACNDSDLGLDMTEIGKGPSVIVCKFGTDSYRAVHCTKLKYTLHTHQLTLDKDRLGYATVTYIHLQTSQVINYENYVWIALTTYGLMSNSNGKKRAPRTDASLHSIRVCIAIKTGCGASALMLGCIGPCAH